MAQSVAGAVTRAACHGSEDVSSDAPTGDHALESTRSLIDRSGSGDDEARRALFVRHAERFEHWALARLAPRLRDEIALTPLVRRALGDVLDAATTSTEWPVGAFQARLRTRVLTLIGEHLESDARPHADLTPLESIVGSERLDRYDRALERLAPDEREAVIARIELCLDYEAIALEIDGATVEETRQLVTRAVTHLAERMTDGERREP